tara:strand:- start:1579 stop:2541 length:963 start_codon:yes stop_codon:yes gene_type:complete
MKSLKLKNMIKKIYIAGHNGMVGSAIYRKLLKKKKYKLITASKKKLNLLNQKDTFNFLKKNRPDLVINAAAKVGGIHANNSYRTEFLYNNLQIQNNLIYSSHDLAIDNFIFLGSSCIYPKFSRQPIKEKYLLSSHLENSNEPYAISKIAGLKLCESIQRQYKRNYFSLMPSNLYGTNDNYEDLNAHVIPALIKKIHSAKIKNLPNVEVWGTGKPKREFMHVDDLADACLFLINKKIKFSYINIGSSEEISIKNLVKLLCDIIGYKGKIKYNKTFPDGTPRKKLDISRIKKLGWSNTIKLSEGLDRTYKEYKKKIGRNINF